MTRSPDHRRRFVVATALAAVLGVGLASMLLANARKVVARERAERAAVVATNGLADLTSRLWGQPDQLRKAVDAFAREYGDARVRVVRLDTQPPSLLASTDPEEKGRIAGEQSVLPPKELYDRGKQLSAAVETNRQEGAAERVVIDVATPSREQADLMKRGQLEPFGFSVVVPILGKAAPEAVQQDVPVMPAPEGVPGDEGAPPVDLGPLGAEPAAPTTVGIVEVRAPVEPPVPGVSIPLALLALVLPVALVALAGLLVGDRRAVLAVVAVAITVAALFGYHVLASRAVRRDLLRAQGEVAGQLERALGVDRQVLAAVGAVESPPLDAARWNTDLYGAQLPASTDDAAIAQLGARLGLAEGSQIRSQLLIGALALALMLFVGLGGAAAVGATLVEHRQAYLYILPAVLGTLVLVFFPFIYGITISFTDQNIYNTNRPLAEIWVGFRNYWDIISDVAVMKRTATGGFAINYANFYWTLAFTIIWTITNVTYGVTVGLILALVLNQKIAARPIYRVLLIFPWAMPNYITALIWKGMFHQQFGVVNQIIQLFGGQAIAWFDRPFTSFLTAFATNGWLSFPFMMVVSLGALQSIPADIYEAARVDGASKWQQFKAITLPSLKPALVPAVILSVVWTFNMFNIIFLVTGGEPGSSTEILVTQSYKFAFERYRYGYAAAYSTIIFGILLVYGAFQNKISRATEAA